MKGILLFLTLAATLLLVTAQLSWKDRRTYPPHRFRRAAESTIKIDEGKLHLDHQRDILRNQNGALIGGLSAQKAPHQDWAASARLQGNYQVGHGHLSGGVSKPLIGPERNPTFSAGYSHDIWRGENGRISAGVSAMKLPHQDWQPLYDIHGSWNF